MTRTNRSWLVLMLALAMLILPASSFAQSAAGLYRIGETPVFEAGGFLIDRPEDDSSALQAAELVGRLTDRANEPEDKDLFQVRLTERLSGPEDAVRLAAAELCLQLDPNGDEENRAAFADALSGLVSAARAAGPGDEFLYALPSFEDGSPAAALGTGCEERFLSLFILAPDETGAPALSGQFVYTEWGVVLCQSNPQTGVIRPDGTFAVLQAGQTDIVLLDSADLTPLDCFTLTVLPEGAQGALLVRAGGEPVGSVSLKVGDSLRLSVGYDSPDTPLSSVIRLFPEEEAAAGALPDAVAEWIGEGVLIPSLPPEEGAEDRPVLAILG